VVCICTPSGQHSQQAIAALEAGPAPDAGAGADPRGIAPTGHIAIVRDFIEALGLGRSPRIDGDQGRRSLAAVLAVYEAAGLV
jgi:predicted dehydrogenase